MRKIIFWGLGLLLVGGLITLWQIGQTDKDRQSAIQKQTQAELLKQDQKLHSLVGDILAGTSTLAEFDSQNLPARLTTKNLKTTRDNATSTIRQYGLSLAQILRPFGELTENDAQIMLRALDNLDQFAAQKLSDDRALYQNTVRGLLLVKVPKDLLTSQTKLINNLKIMASLSGNMGQVLQNPLLALQSAEQYQKSLALFYTSINEINSFFTKVGVKFTEDEKIKINLNL